jgi:TolB protein
MSVGGGPEHREPAHLSVLDLETQEMRQLTQGSGRDHLPAWSPDGSTIAFITHDLPIGSAPSTLYSIRPDGTGPQLTDGRSQTTPASWSPDGKQLAFASDREGPWQLYLMDADGTNVQRIEAGEGNVEPAWSPDGTTIAYMAGAREGEFDVHTFNLQTGETRQLTGLYILGSTGEAGPNGIMADWVTQV